MDSTSRYAAARLPVDVVAHGVWVPTGAGPDGGRIVFVTERSRRRVAVLILPVVLLGLVLVIAYAPGAWLVTLLVAALAVAGAVADYHRGGRAGFYRLEDDGRLGEFLGRQNPGLSQHQRVRASSAGS
ncbi:general stress protein CsbA [Micromonospora luteifusca]|uniref:General stress protein CsbA n=1 Tax=Micromonospora luteifusca TaxID=709860 RepID=A0ABS2M2X8_9ACTN|nr:hypothetical protein [Micromonospora luteifusca]MBM7494542.1 general stress protein CsbA [Micromonospora luteifusca]